MNLLNLDNDASKRKRSPSNSTIREYLAKNRYCFSPKISLDYFNNAPNNMWGLEKHYVNLLRNLDYRIIKDNGNNDTELREKVKRFLLTIPLVITSVQIDGILSPLCMNSPGHIHPGNKRIMISRYLDIKYVPIFGRYNHFPKHTDELTEVKSDKDIVKLFGKKISIYFVNGNLEIFYHSSNYRDKYGHDDFTKKANEIRNLNNICSNNIEYLLTHGLEVVHPSFSNTHRENNGYITKFVNQPTNHMYINLLDINIQHDDFWELIFHFDYSTYKKSCYSNKIEIINTTVKDRQSYSVKIVETLGRKKVYI
jgi:hypothetical protein